MIELEVGEYRPTYPGNDVLMPTVTGRLTWQGHEFLDAARNTKTWDSAKKFIADKGGSLTFDVLKGVLTQLTRQAVGL